MNIAVLAGLAVVTAILALSFRRRQPEWTIIISLCGGVLMLIIIAGEVSPLIAGIRQLTDKIPMAGELSGILFKAAGICWIAQMAADICRDAQETALAARVELAGKVLLLAMSLPLFLKLAQIAAALINGEPL